MNPCSIYSENDYFCAISLPIILNYLFMLYIIYQSCFVSFMASVLLLHFVGSLSNSLLFVLLSIHFTPFLSFFSLFSSVFRLYASLSLYWFFFLLLFPYFSSIFVLFLLLFFVFLFFFFFPISSSRFFVLLLSLLFSLSFFFLVFFIILDVTTTFYMSIPDCCGILFQNISKFHEYFVCCSSKGRGEWDRKLTIFPLSIK